MNELSFLLDLFLNHKLPKSAKEAILARVKELEANIVLKHTPQTPSTHKFEIPLPSQGIEQIAQTPLAQAALAARQAAMSGGNRDLYKAKPKSPAGA